MWTFFFAIIFIISFFTDKAFRYIIYGISYIGLILYVYLKNGWGAALAVSFPLILVFLGGIITVVSAFKDKKENKK